MNIRKWTKIAVLVNILLIFFWILLEIFYGSNLYNNKNIEEMQTKCKETYDKYFRNTNFLDKVLSE